MMTEIFSRSTLQEAWSAGERPDYVFFWGSPTGRRVYPSEMGPWIFSQWYPSAPFNVGGIKYATAEHWMMAEKARVFEDAETLGKILANSNGPTPDPHEAKKLGRQVKGFQKSLWDTRAFTIVVAGSVAKFSQNPVLERYLLGTGDSVLVEASPHDIIWGIGLEGANPNARDPFLWKGLNLLGFALMVARKMLCVRHI